MAEERFAWQERGDRAEERAAAYQTAWHSARRLARVMSEELTRRAPLTGQPDKEGTA